MDPIQFYYLILAALLLLANAFFVAAEFSLVGVRRTKIEEMARKGNRSAARVREILAHLDAYLSSCQVGITLASLGLGWIGERSFAHLFEKAFLLAGLSAGAATWSAHGLAVIVAFILVTFLHIVVGEMAPKTLSLRFPETLSFWISWPMRAFHRAFYPITWVLNNSSLLLLRSFGLKVPATHARVHSEEELGLILDESHRAGLLGPDERKMLERVFRFHDRTVKEIMVPRLDIVALNLRAEPAKVMEMAIKEGYSRLPVFDGNLDKIVGIIYVKDLIYTLRDPTLIKLVDLVREYIEVSETYSVSKLLRDFQKRRIHLAIVVDEHGATAGLVTLEDLVEEIVGEIQDEHDEEPAEVEKLADGAVIFLGKAHLDHFREHFPGQEIPEGDFETVGGLVLHLAGRVPKEGDSFRLGDLALRVALRDGRRINKVAVWRVPPGATQHFQALSAEPKGAGAGPEVQRPASQRQPPQKEGEAAGRRGSSG